MKDQAATLMGLQLNIVAETNAMSVQQSPVLGGQRPSIRARGHALSRDLAYGHSMSNRQFVCDDEAHEIIMCSRIPSVTCS